MAQYRIKTTGTEGSKLYKVQCRDRVFIFFTIWRDVPGAGSHNKEDADLMLDYLQS